jgi:LPXTG-motif cell wall-anchored protein
MNVEIVLALVALVAVAAFVFLRKKKDTPPQGGLGGGSVKDNDHQTHEK